MKHLFLLNHQCTPGSRLTIVCILFLGVQHNIKLKMFMLLNFSLEPLGLVDQHVAA